MEHLEKAGVGGMGLSERERGSVFKQMGEMKKKIQVMTTLQRGRTRSGQSDNATATKSCKAKRSVALIVVCFIKGSSTG